MTLIAEPSQVALGWSKPAAVVGTFARTVDSASVTGGVGGNSTAALNDEVNYDFALMTGTYKMVAVGTTHANAPIVDWQLDGSSIGTQEWYTLATTKNVIKTISGINVNTAGIYRLKALASSKNGASGGYGMLFTSIAMVRTDDPTLDLDGFGLSLPTRCEIFPMARAEYSTVGNVSIAASSSLGGGQLTTSGAVGNAVTWMCLLPFGTYDMTALFFRGSNRGITTMKIGGVTKGTFDQYGGSAANTVGSITGFTVPTDGIYPVQFICESKNALSSGYFQLLHHIVLRKVA